MAALKNHPGLWLADPAAAALARLEAAHGVVRVNSAGRSVAGQNGLIARWDRGGKANRPPYLYEPARPAERSNHVKQGGIAIDTPEIAKMQHVGPAFGWYQPHPKTDPVHFEYDGSRDPSRSSGGAPAFPLPAGSYFGPRNPTSNKRSVSGYFGRGGDLQRWQQQMRSRGWQIAADGRYGDQTRNVARAFQAEKGLLVDGLIGPATWSAAWTAPVTR